MRQMLWQLKVTDLHKMTVSTSLKRLTNVFAYTNSLILTILKSTFLVCVFFVVSLAQANTKVHPLPPNLILRTVVETTLLLQPDILLQDAQREVTFGNFLVQAGFFDLYTNYDMLFTHDMFPLQKFQQVVPGIVSQNSDDGVLNAGVSKTFLNGVTLTPSINMLRNQNNINEILGIPIENRSFVNFTINVPFLKGSAVGLTARAAYLTYLSQQYSYAHTISKSVLDSVTAYWQYRGSYESMNYLREAVRTDKQIVESVKKMMENGEQTRTDLVLAKANYEGRLAFYYITRERYFENKRTLAVLMGIKSENIRLLPPPTSPFAKERHMKFTQAALPQFFINMMKYRNDIQAALLTIKANFALMKLDQTNLGPQLNGLGSVGYRGLNEGTNNARALSNNTQAPVYSLGLKYTFPVENNTARGTYMAQSAIYAQSQIVYRDLIRTIKLNLILAFNRVQLFGLQKVYSTNAEQYYNISVNDELEKLKFGEASLIDVLRIKDLLVQAELSRIDSQSSYSQALASLYFEQGLFYCHDHMHCLIDLTQIS